MDIVFSFVPKFLDFLDALFDFFFTPMSDVLPKVASHLVVGSAAFSKGWFGRLVSKVFDFLFSLIPALEQLTVAEFLLGSSIVLFVLVRLAKFILPLLE